MEVKVVVTKKVPVKDSILVCGFPGIAYIGKLSLDHLIQELNSELVGEVYSPFFPPYVLIKKDGIVELLKNELYFVEGSEKNIFLLTGNTQAASPEGQYKITEAILDHVSTLGVTQVFSLAAFLTNKSFKKPKVHGTTTDLTFMKELTKHGIVPMKDGVISGMNGLIFGLAKTKNMIGACLLGETHGYQTPSGEYLLDAKAAKTVLEVLAKLLNLKVNMKPLEKQTKQLDELISKITDVERRMKDELKEQAKQNSRRYIT
jgi:uncharacterized protein (TIGR00162 family)